MSANEHEPQEEHVELLKTGEDAAKPFNRRNSSSTSFRLLYISRVIDPGVDTGA